MLSRVHGELGRRKGARVYTFVYIKGVLDWRVNLTLLCVSVRLEQNGTYYPNALTRSTCSLSHRRGMKDALRVFIQPDNMCFCACCPFEWLDYVLFAQGMYTYMYT